MDTDKIVKLDCFNPFDKPNHPHARKGLRRVTSWMCHLIPGTPETSKVCDSCRKQLTKLKDEKCREILPGTSHEETQSETEIEEAPTDIHIPFSNESESLRSLNSSLLEMGESPIDKKRMSIKTYSTNKANRINVAVKRKLLVNACTEDEDSNSQDVFFKHIKEVYKNLTSRKKKLQLLTLVPDSWSVKKIMQEFSATNYLARQAKILLKNKGALSSPDLKAGKSLPTHVVDIVKDLSRKRKFNKTFGNKNNNVISDSTCKKLKLSESSNSEIKLHQKLNFTPPSTYDLDRLNNISDVKCKNDFKLDDTSVEKKSCESPDTENQLDSMSSLISKMNNLHIASNLKVAPNEKTSKANVCQISRKRKFNKTFGNKNNNEISVISDSTSKKLKLSESSNSEIKLHQKLNFAPPSSLISKMNKLHILPNLMTFPVDDNCHIKIDDLKIPVYMLKSLDPFISDDEEKSLQYISPNFKRGWLYGNVIDGFLTKLKSKSKKFTFLYSCSLSVMHSGSIDTNIVKRIDMELPLVIPIIINFHWVLLIINFKDRLFEFYDPLNMFCSEKYLSLIQKWLYFNIKEHLKIICPPHVIQADSISCGVFICYFVYQKVVNNNLNEEFDTCVFRKFIFEILTEDNIWYKEKN